MLNRDFRDMLSALSAAKVEFLLVGAYAMAVHGLPRATGDMDLWVRCSAENAQRIMTALVRFGAPLRGVTAADFQQPGAILQIGVAPCRIDILTAIDGVEFDDAWDERSEAVLNGLTLPVLSRKHLLQNKRATGRPKDAADARWIEDQEA